MSNQNCEYNKKITERYNYPSGASPCDYYSLGKLPFPQPRVGAGFGTRSMRDVMEWQNIMGNVPYPWGPNGQQFIFYSN
jgi:hypothetical protein